MKTALKRAVPVFARSSHGRIPPNGPDGVGFHGRPNRICNSRFEDGVDAKETKRGNAPSRKPGHARAVSGLEQN